ncbi:ligase-associated DNA damage response DEXH box helicase [Cytophaga aurantiaca]|uniref:ligase-associated DNA damage response DEXH box helicase n=1 Tax=Cytophaga aurantiaca TaxID=29530 RepID=UPI00037D3E97|nr:ligase-associated DNA damage response DEXH box helicase [Cytophaga aurantiaca]
MTEKDILAWFKNQKWKAHTFQQETWKSMLDGYSGLVNAPTGSGKTYSVWFGILLEYLKKNPGSKTKKKAGLQAIWITPIRALAKEIQYATTRSCVDLDIPFEVAIRSGDTTTAQKTKQKKNMPQLLVTTPESLHLLLSQKGYADVFKDLSTVVVDEWHELIGSKRGVQMELALSRLKGLNPDLKIWGISATIGNLEEAKDVLLGNYETPTKMIRAELPKRVEIETIFPDKIENFPWSGFVGTKLLPKVVPIIHSSNSVLIFTNTRSQSEIWYRQLLEVAPEFAGLIALHHGSLDQKTRTWVEDNLHAGKLKAVICTSSLDLGVDFSAVDTVVQVGSPKGVARFMQRAGRSGHSPGALSKIYFVPTNSLEIIEGAAMRESIKRNVVESRIPYIRSFDVLVQYLVTLAVADGFKPEVIYSEIKKTFCYASVTPEEFAWALQFITNGGNSLDAYDEFHKVVIEDGIYKVIDRSIASRHRLSMGTIVSYSAMQVKYLSGKRLGSIEENFISKLKPGDVFWFSGNNLEIVHIHHMDVLVRKSKAKKGLVPSWQGGRMPLSSQLAEMIRYKIDHFFDTDKIEEEELKKLKELFDLQAKRSHLPTNKEFLIEYVESREGYHVFMYPFEGRFVHEGMAAIVARKISEIKPMTFSVAMNDYGFELLSDQEIPIEEALELDLFGIENLEKEIQLSINATEMARRRFREIASIAGLVFQGYPGKSAKTRHLQANAELFFKVFEQYDSSNLLLRQAYDEVLDFQLEIQRMRKAYNRINEQKLVLVKPEKVTPFAYPIMVDRMRGKFTNEKLEDRLFKMKTQLEKE